MISVNMVKCMIDKNFFRIEREEGMGLLKDKLLQLSCMLLSNGDGKDQKGTYFNVYLTPDGPTYTSEGRATQGYYNTACEEIGWSWSKITGPSQSSEYYYSDYFNRRRTDYFEHAYFIYFDLFRFKSLETVRGRLDSLMCCQTLEALRDKINDLAIEVLDYEELVNMIVCAKEDGREDEEIDMVTVVKTLILCAYYLYHSVNGTSMESDLTKTMNGNFCLCFPEEEIDAEEYMDHFLTVLEGAVDCSEEGMKFVMDLLLNVHFSYATDQHEKTPTLYFYRSKSLKTYKDLREHYAGDELVAYLDKLVPMLEDPAFMIDGIFMDSFMLEPETCVVESGYTNEEYVCCYYYYERNWAEEREYVNFDYAFSIARKCFEVLFQELCNKATNENAG